ncbi:MAG: c-type cytochrome [Nitrospiraceae bacterium]
MLTVRGVRTMQWFMRVGLFGLLPVWVACGQGAATQEAAPGPAEFRTGEAKFNANCARCHGERAGGTAQGPPLVHKIYEPNHHGDPAFQRAAANGVRAHHWKFGDMPKIEGVTPEDVQQIIHYVRWLQRQAGIM